jgi:S1-C subfamily serine protease
MMYNRLVNNKEDVEMNSSKICAYCGARVPALNSICHACGKPLSYEPQKSAPGGSNSKRSGGEHSLCDVIDLVTNATVRINCIAFEGNGSLGTGFFVDHKGSTYLITNFHVISGAVGGNAMITVRFPENINPRNDCFNVDLVGVDPLNDVALLDVQFDMPNGAVTLQLEDLSKIRRGQQVVAVGNPHGMNFNCIEGIISNTNYRDSDMTMSKILCSLSAAPGNSGGPVVNVSSEKVIGIATAIFDPNYMQSHTICASADSIRQMIFAYEKKRK